MDQSPIAFPFDHKSHDATIEWWYFNGLLKDALGNRYSFMDCLFKADIAKAKIPHLEHASLQKFLGKSRNAYFAHSVISDIEKQENHKEVQEVSIVSADSFTKERLFVDYIDPIILRGYVDNEIAETDENIFRIKNKFIDLVLESKKPALLEGGSGYINVGGRESRYYSLTSLETRGTISIGGRTIEVKGKSWMDHQWADVPYAKDKWTWFSIQLEDGTDIMCCEYDDGKTKERLVDIIDASNTQSHYNQLNLRPGNNVWKSEETKAEYPMSWDIEIPEYGAKLRAKSLMTDQEMIFMSINYWEGPIEVSGTVNGKKVIGVGFMELVGYPSKYNPLLRLGKEIKEKISGKEK